MSFDLIIFDCDGVLIDSELLSVQADIACLAEYGIEMSAEEITERYTGTSGMLADLEARYGRTLPGFGERYRQLVRPLLEAELKAIPGVAAVLDSLACRRCIASSSGPEGCVMLYRSSASSIALTRTSSVRRWWRAASRRPICFCTRPSEWEARPTAASSSRTACRGSPPQSPPA